MHPKCFTPSSEARQCHQIFYAGKEIPKQYKSRLLYRISSIRLFIIKLGLVSPNFLRFWGIVIIFVESETHACIEYRSLSWYSSYTRHRMASSVRRIATLSRQEIGTLTFRSIPLPSEPPTNVYPNPLSPPLSFPYFPFKRGYNPGNLF